MGSHVQGHDGNERQRRKERLHHGQRDGGQRPQITKAVQQCLPVFQRAQLMGPLQQRMFHLRFPQSLLFQAAAAQPPADSISRLYDRAMNRP